MATALGLVLLTLAVLAAHLHVVAAALTAGGAAIALLGASFLSDAPDMRALCLALLGATVPAALAAVRLPGLRTPATGAALLAPSLAILTARADGLLSVPVAGLLLALLAATAFALAATGEDPARTVWVLVVAALTMVLAGRTGVRAPLLVGTFTTLAVALGLTVRALPWPLIAALLVGMALLAVGRLREGRPVAAFGRRVADLR